MAAINISHMLVKRKPKVYAEAAKEKGPMFYDYENNVNLIWRYTFAHTAFPTTTRATGRSAEGSIRRCSKESA